MVAAKKLLNDMHTKRFFLLIAIAMTNVVTMADDIITDFYICGERLSWTTINDNKFLKSGNMSYDESRGILTLENATLSLPANSDKHGIRPTGMVAILLKGKNTINMECEDFVYSEYTAAGGEDFEIYGIGSNPSLRIVGSSSVTSASAFYVKDTNLTFYDLTISADTLRWFANSPQTTNALIAFSNCDVGFTSKYTDDACVYGFSDVTLEGCYFFHPVDVLVNAQPYLASNLYDQNASESDQAVKGSFTIRRGLRSDITIGRKTKYGKVTDPGEYISTTYVPFLSAGDASYDMDNNELTLKDATISVSSDGIMAPDGLNIRLIGENYLYTSGDAVTLLSNDQSITGNGSLTIMSDGGYGITMEEMLEVGDAKTVPTLDIYGKLGAIDGRKRWNSYYNDYVMGYLDPYECYITLRSDGSNAVVHDISSLWEKYISYNYNYYFDSEQHTVIDGETQQPVTHYFKIVPENVLNLYNIHLGGHNINNYNCSDFQPQSLTQGSVSYDPDTKTLQLINARFDSPFHPYDDMYALFLRDGHYTIELIGDNSLVGTNTNDFEHGMYLEADDTDCIVDIIGSGDDLLELGGTVYLYGWSGGSTSLNLKNMKMNIPHCAYIVGESGDEQLNVIRSEVSLRDYEWDTTCLIEYLNLSLQGCHFNHGHYYDNTRQHLYNSDGEEQTQFTDIIRNSGGTGIDSWRYENQIVDCESVNSQCYNLQGCRLNGKPDKPGIYILNGKKVIKK